MKTKDTSTSLRLSLGWSMRAPKRKDRRGQGEARIQPELSTPRENQATVIGQVDFLRR